MSRVSSNYAPDPPDAKDRKSRLKYVAGFILITEFCERLAYYGLAGSIVLFFQTQMRLSNQEADVQYSIWSGMCYVTPLLGGYIADTYLGRYKTILVMTCLYWWTFSVFMAAFVSFFLSAVLSHLPCGSDIDCAGFYSWRRVWSSHLFSALYHRSGHRRNQAQRVHSRCGSIWRQIQTG